MQGIRRHIGSRFVLIMAGAALISVVGHSQQLREYIYLGNNVIAIDSGTPAVVSATVGNPLDDDKLNIPVGLVFSGPSPSVINILINSDLNGTSACYLAIVPASNVAFLVADSGPPDLLPAVPFNSTQSATNSQCTVTGTGIGYTSSSTGGLLNVTIQFNSNFKGKKVMYAAVRTTIGGNSGWQSVGAIRVGKFGMDDPTSTAFDGRVKNPVGSQNMTVSSSTENTISAELWNPLYKTN